MEIETQQMPRSSPSKTQSKMAFFKSKNGKCQRPGPVGRNPYLNFLREFRKRNCGLSAVETIRRGAKEWKTLPKEKKLQYIEAAKAARSYPRRQIMLSETEAGMSETEMSETEEAEEAFVPQKKEKKKKMRKGAKGQATEETWMQEAKKAKKLQMLTTGWICRL